MDLAACLRGSEPMRVPTVTSMTKAEFADYLNRRAAENPQPDPNVYETALTLLGILEPGGLSQEALVADDLEFVWGLYRFREKDVIIVDHGVPSDEPAPNSVLVHEFVHALQDADVNLSAFFDEHATSYDSYLAAASISEGEARLHQSRFWASLIGLDPGAVDWDEHLLRTAEYGEERVLDADSPFTASYNYFPYEVGARYVHFAFRANGLTGVEELFASPPERAVALMASDTSLSRADWPASEFPELVATDPWLPEIETTLGAWGTFLHLAELTAPPVAKTTALDLLGDRMTVYTIADSSDAITETAVVWQLEFGSEASAERVEALVRSSPASVARAGTRLVLARTTGSSPLDWALIP